MLGQVRRGAGALPPSRSTQSGGAAEVASPGGAAGPKPRSVAPGTWLYVQRPCRVGPQLGLGAGGESTRWARGGRTLPEERAASARLPLPGTARLAGLRSSRLIGEGTGSETEALGGLGPRHACPLFLAHSQSFPCHSGSSVSLSEATTRSNSLHRTVI